MTTRLGGSAHGGLSLLLDPPDPPVVNVDPPAPAIACPALPLEPPLEPPPATATPPAPAEPAFPPLACGPACPAACSSLAPHAIHSAKTPIVAPVRAGLGMTSLLAAINRSDTCAP